jgi:hypothetical protein
MIGKHPGDVKVNRSPLVSQFEFWASCFKNSSCHSRGMKRPRDPNQLAKSIVDIATGQAEDTVSEAKRHPESVRGRAGGLAGGKARVKSLSADQRRKLAVKAAEARWQKVRGD